MNKPVSVPPRISPLLLGSPISQISPKYRSLSPSFRAESWRHRGPNGSSSRRLGPTWFCQGDGRENPEVLQGGTRKDMECQAPGRVF